MNEEMNAYRVNFEEIGDTGIYRDTVYVFAQTLSEAARKAETLQDEKFRVESITFSGKVVL